MNTCPSVKNAHRGTERRRSQRPGARTSSPQHSACTHASASHFSISTSTAPFCLPHTAWMTSSSGRATRGGLKPALQGSRCFRRSIAAAHAFIAFFKTDFRKEARGDARRRLEDQAPYLALGIRRPSAGRAGCPQPAAVEAHGPRSRNSLPNGNESSETLWQNHRTLHRPLTVPQHQRCGLSQPRACRAWARPPWVSSQPPGSKPSARFTHRAYQQRLHVPPPR